jgi:hypothetical protein
MGTIFDFLSNLSKENLIAGTATPIPTARPASYL